MTDILNADVLHVLETTFMLLLAIFAGYVLRRKKVLDGHTTSQLSAFVVDIAFPLLVFTSMLGSADPGALAESWYVPLAGMAVILLAMGTGTLVSPLFSRSDAARRGSAAFAIGMPNWIFIPLPLAVSLFGMTGERIVLLFNLGALLVFWSLGVGILEGGSPGGGSLRRALLNPGLLATLLGILTALVFPAARTLEGADITGLSLPLSMLSILVKAMAFLGGITVPLSMIVTGSLLAEAGTREAWNHRVMGITFFRLLVFPGIVLGLLCLAGAAGLRLPREICMVLVIISAMPVAVSCSIVAEKVGGDVDLISHAILVSTLASVVTVPAFVWLLRLLTV